jgi:fucose permease
LCAIFLLGYVGVEVSLGGWVVQFMLRVRSADAFDAGMASVGFWLGLTVGRATLGLLTPRIGVKLSLMIFDCSARILSRTDVSVCHTRCDRTPAEALTC